MTRRPWSPADLAFLCRRRAAGDSYRAIAAALGRTVCSVYNRDVVIRRGDVVRPWRQTCSLCEKPHRALGLCLKHYVARRRRMGKQHHA